MTPASMSSILIRNATIIDGTGAAPFLGSIGIMQGYIKKIGVLTDEEIRKYNELIDATGMYITPGMIDCHVHVMMNGYDPMAHMTTPFSLNFYKAIDNLNTLLHAGITSARDAGGADLGVKKALEEAVIAGPRLKISISPLTTTGGHVDGWMPSGIPFHMLSPPYPGSPSGICDGPNEVRKTVRTLLRSGADVIKTCSTGGVMGPNDDPEYTQFTIEELEVMVTEAAMRKNKKVMAHAQGLEGIKNALKAGVHSIEHGVYLDEEAIELFLERKVFLVPTLLVEHSVIEGDYPDTVKDRAKRIYEVHQKSMEMAVKAGVKIAMGTDSGVMRHGKNLKELQLLCEVGMSPMEAVVMATKTAAECLEIANETGTLEEGKLADLLLLKKNPLEDINALYEKGVIAAVFQQGKRIENQK